MRVHRSIAAAIATIALVAATLVGGAGVRQAAVDEPTLHFTASGDFSSGANALSVFSGIGAIAPDLHLALGDLSYGTVGQEQAWCDLVTARVGAGFPFELLAGNHESNGQNGNINDFSACLPNQLPGLVGTYGRQYYVDVPAGAPLVRYVMISPGIPFTDGTWSYAAGTPRYSWTANAIDGARTANIPWVVVGMHKPCLSLGEYPCDPGAAIMNLLVDKRVDLVLSGHEHLYQRSHQLATGDECSALAPNSFTPACVVDSDQAMVKGAGTVFATVGTGGVSLRNVNLADTESGYFSASSGSNSNPTFGSLDVIASATELTATFARAAGGTFTDSFSLGPADPTVNSAPVARPSGSCVDLACDFSGSSSTDSDGTIQAYEWDFGDGASASGTAVSHDYSVAGTYTVRLTVTDDDGASGSATTSVTAADPAPVGALASDDFSRTTVGGWGSATAGGPWSVTSPVSRFSVDGSTGLLQLPAGVTGTAFLAGVSSSNTDLRMNLSVSKLPTSGSVYMSVAPRRVASVGAYQAKIVLTSSGRATLALVRVNAAGGGEVALQSGIIIPGVTYVPGSKLAVRVRATGTNPTILEARVWPAEGVEPATWQRSVSDATAALQASGGIQFSSYLSGSATNGPVVVGVDDLVAQVP